MRNIQDANLENKKIILRVDFNVAVENGKAKEVFKLKACEESLELLLKNKNKVALMTYFGRPEGKIVPEMSLSQLKDDLENILKRKIIFVDDCIGEKVKNAIDKLGNDEILLLENVRFYPEEEINDENFSRRLAENFDAFVNEVFSQSHRNQSSITGITKFIPSFAGLRLQKEIENLDKVRENPIKPAVAIIGGAKIETKLPLIGAFDKKYDHILVGGKIANEAIDQNFIFSEKVLLPSDFGEGRLDIGPKTIEKFKEIIVTAKNIVWNGPMGKFEEKPHDTGTKEILKAVINSGAFTLMGGGESVQILEENDAMDKISFVSTGGGAMLEYLSGKTLPGIEVLKNK